MSPSILCNLVHGASRRIAAGLCVFALAAAGAPACSRTTHSPEQGPPTNPDPGSVATPPQASPIAGQPLRLVALQRLARFSVRDAGLAPSPNAPPPAEPAAPPAAPH